MNRLIFRDACFSGITGVEERRIDTSEEHKRLVEEANRKIDEAANNRRVAYENAANYLGE